MNELRTPDSGRDSVGDAAARILVVDDDHAFRLSTAALLRADGYAVDAAGDGPQAVEALRGSRYDAMLLDLRMPGVDGLGIVETLRRWGDGIPILMISGYGTIDTAVRALHLGADDYLSKPVEPDVLSARVRELLERRPTRERRVPAEATIGMTGRSPRMLALYEDVRKVASTDATVLITGETGTGKELVAQAVHRLSTRRDRPLLAVNCGSLAEGLLETELFGHVRGAFTGAMRDRAGLFEAAGGGTIVLDEVGEVSPGLQQRLLRVVEQRQLIRVGATKPTSVDVRVIAATHRDLRALVASGRFREDLFYRLNVFPIIVPPLRERRSDIPLLVEHALERLGHLRQRAPGAGRMSCSPFVMRLLREHDWPGNVRELFSVLERAAIHADGENVDVQHLPAELRLRDSADGVKRYRSGSGPEAGEEERAAIAAALEQTGGVLSRSADLLGMGRTTLWRKIKAYGLLRE